MAYTKAESLSIKPHVEVRYTRACKSWLDPTALNEAKQRIAPVKPPPSSKIVMIRAGRSSIWARQTPVIMELSLGANAVQAS